jgi:hypothetical protein
LIDPNSYFLPVINIFESLFKVIFDIAIYSCPWEKIDCGRYMPIYLSDRSGLLLKANMFLILIIYWAAWNW